MITLYFVRHGETVWNHSGRYQGMTDVPLSETGRQQAAKTVDFFQDIPLDGVYSSDLSRAADTARGIAESHQLPLHQDRRLRELSFGDWEGLTYEEIEARWPGSIEQMYRHPAEIRISGGETFGEVQKRASAAVSGIMDGQDGKTFLIASHGGTIRTILCSLLGLPLDKAWTFCQANANVSCVFCNKDRNLLYLLNGTEHLRENR